ncbi:MAG TPA: P1 family peptidase [Acidobacteriota bacterium]|nr:P1 family peptidase [Acidobacteriota bacterium]HNU01627.1 P1 family peptidase [Acidobacteriota bacterium]HPB28225.1 P1 family peptidase [Acidobacteriota bacterium]HQO24386.1 P1 family peptidase [Acidobacteriota bacterium]HQP73091.1 P1 family peptidase [Acidobacteriota bacterium]
MKQQVTESFIIAWLVSVALLPLVVGRAAAAEPARCRAREMGVVIGILPPGPLNTITDVAGVRVGHVTLIEGRDIRTGVTAVLPHGGNLFREKVPAAIHVANGFGKLAGSTQVNELGEIETPIVLTNTLSVGTAVSAVVAHLLALPGNTDVRSVNAVVGETNDGFLNDIRALAVRPEHVHQAIRAAVGGPVAEGAVGAGTGTVCFGYKGGIGTASRKLPHHLGGWTVGVLVQTNFGGILQVNGAPVGRELGRYYLKDELSAGGADGSCMIVVATDAPLLHRNLRRLAERAVFGLVRTGGTGANGSGDYAIAFSTCPDNRLRPDGPRTLILRETRNDDLTPLFLAAAEASEEAVLNSLFQAQTTDGLAGHRVDALPLDAVRRICEKYGALDGGAGARPTPR